MLTSSSSARSPLNDGVELSEVRARPRAAERARLPSAGRAAAASRAGARARRRSGSASRTTTTSSARTASRTRRRRSSATTTWAAPRSRSRSRPRRHAGSAARPRPPRPHAAVLAARRARRVLRRRGRDSRPRRRQAGASGLFPTQVADWQSEERVGSAPIGTGSSFDVANHPIAERLRLLGRLRDTRIPALSTGATIVRTAASRRARLPPDRAGDAKREYSRPSTPAPRAANVSVATSTRRHGWTALLGLGLRLDRRAGTARVRPCRRSPPCCSARTPRSRRRRPGPGAEGCRRQSQRLLVLGVPGTARAGQRLLRRAPQRAPRRGSASASTTRRRTARS